MAKGICSFEGSERTGEGPCDRPAHARGWCAKHYARWHTNGDPALTQDIKGELDRFNAKVDHLAGPVPAHAPELGPCSLWTAAKNSHGYGAFWLDGRDVGAHIAAVVLEGSDVPSGMEVMHLCDNPPCVRVDHLTIGTTEDNARDRQAKGRGNAPKGSRNGLAKLTEDQVIEIRRRYAAGGILHRELALEFGVCRETIGLAVRRQKWAHVP